MIETVRGLSAALALLLLAGAIGDAILRHLLPAARSRLERVVLAVGLGLGAFSYLPLVLGAFHLLQPNSLLTAWVAGLVAATVLILKRRSCFEFGETPPAAASAEPLPPWALGFALVTALAFLGYAGAALTPMVDYDGLAYHVAVPARWLESGTARDLPTWLHSYWPLGTEMLFALLLPVGGVEACKPLVAAMAGLTAMATVALGERMGSKPAGIVAAGLLVWRMDAPSIGTTSVEAPLTLYVVLAALALAEASRGDDPRQRRPGMALCVLFAGFACSAKLNGLFCAGFLALAVVLTLRPTGLRNALLGGVLVLAGAFLLASPWYLRTWFLTGNPIFPFGYSALGGRHWSAEASEALRLYFRTFVLPGDTVAERLAFVQRHTVKLAILTAGAVALPAPRWVRGMALAAGVFAMAQVQTSDIARFLLPAVPFGALALGWWASRVAQMRYIGPVSGATLVVWIGCVTLPGAVLQAASTLPVAAGLQNRSAFLDRYVNNRAAFEWANRHLPPDASLLYGPDNRTLFLRRRCYWSSEVFQQHIDYQSEQATKESLRRLGIRYLVLNIQTYRDPAIRFETKMGWRASEKARLDEARRAARLLFAANECEIYDLAPYLGSRNLKGELSRVWNGSSL